MRILDIIFELYKSENESILLNYEYFHAEFTDRMAI